MTGGTMLVMKYRLLFVLLAFYFLVPIESIWAAPIVPDSFSTTWDTGVTLDIEIVLGTCASAVYWEEIGNEGNNGTSSTCGGGNVMLVTVPTPGQYRVDFSGSLTTINIRFFEGHNGEEFRTVEQWGSSTWSSLQRAFQGVTDLEINATDNPDLSSVTSLREIFEGASNFNSPIGSWDVSSVTDMSDMFLNAVAFNQDLSSWNVSNVNDMQNIFTGSALSSDNYTSILSSWSGLTVQSNVYFDTDAQYCSIAQAARDTLIGTYAWVITDGGARTDCVVEDSNNSRGNSGTRVGDRLKSYFYSSTTTSTPVQVTKESFIQSVRNFVDYLTQNEDDLVKLTPEESAKIIVGLRDILKFLLTLLPSF